MEIDVFNQGNEIYIFNFTSQNLSLLGNPVTCLSKHALVLKQSVKGSQVNCIHRKIYTHIHVKRERYYEKKHLGDLGKHLPSCIISSILHLPSPPYKSQQEKDSRPGYNLWPRKGYSLYQPPGMSYHRTKALTSGSEVLASCPDSTIHQHKVI